MPNKQTRLDRGWRNFSRVLAGEPIHRVDTEESQSSSREQYERLYFAAELQGFEVTIGRNLGIAHTITGEKFSCGGYFEVPNKIVLAYPSFSLLAHEICHGIDHHLGMPYYSGKARIGELVASAASYLLYCTEIRLRSPATEVTYAMQQGARPGDLIKNRDRIFAVYRLIKKMYAAAV